ncbi:hypothetical protein [Agromyces sp. NPDC058064]|uniref:hypothetical protein n=1 Tax=Agromyces sp. NPDC058064 TaxID=3346322 RepID=UPI0036DC93EF
MPTEREWASVIWLVAIVATFVLVPKLRHHMGPSVRAVVESALKPRILLVFGMLLAWSALCVLVGWWVGLWNLALLKDTLIIVFAFGFPMLFHSISMSSGGALLKRVVLDSVGATALLAFYLNLASFPLWAELAIQPLVTLVALLCFTAARQESSRRLVPFFVVLLALAVLGSFAWTTTSLISDWDHIDWIGMRDAFLLTLWLPLLLIPYFYVVAFSAHAESALSRLRFRANERMPLRVHFAFILGLRFSVELAAKFTGRYKGLSRERTFRGAWRYMRRFREDVAAREQGQAEQAETLERLSGVAGTFDDGAQLDRREYGVTKDRLRYIAVTQMGRYDGNGGRYWDDLTDMMVNAERHGLPQDHGFTTETSADGQRWRTWRRMPNGSYLAMGAASGEGDFFFAGPEAPTTWPGESPEWVSDLRDPVLPPDWERSDDRVH